MAGYRCVNYLELCRLCSSNTGNDKKTNIFAEEGTKLDLVKKIADCLQITLNQKDKLPKSICATCLEIVEFMADYRQKCVQSQEMLKNCLNTSKIRNGSQVYIKDEANATPKKFLKTIQQSKLQSKQIQIITTPPQQHIQQTPAKKTPVKTSGSDFLSSIIQAVGIHNSEDSPPQQQVPAIPQYTLTLDGQTLKTGPVQYTLENANVTPNKTIAIESAQQTPLSQMDEFLKIRPTQQQRNLFATPNQKSKLQQPQQQQKPKINFIVTTPTKQTSSSLQTPQPKTFGQTSTLNTPNKSGIQIQDIKILQPSTPTQTPTKFVVPIVLKNENVNSGSTTEQATHQLISQALVGANSNNCVSASDLKQFSGPIHYVQMKLQPNADGQPGFHLAPASMPPVSSISLSPQQFQTLSFSSPTTMAAQQTQVQTAIAQSLQQSQGNQTETKTSESMEEDMNQDDDNDNDSSWMQDDDYQNDSISKEEPTVSAPVIQVSQESQTQQQNATITITGTPKSLRQHPGKSAQSQNKNSPVISANIVTSTSVSSNNSSKTIPPTNSTTNITKCELTPNDQSEIATIQLHQLSSHSIKNVTQGCPSRIQEINLTTCEVCQKGFKKKEFLMQHLKSHIGLRPFKCKDDSCNKSFSRKEHLLRHMCTHTGKKMFSCDLCHKLFSRKDNLSKHRRIHPEANEEGAGKVFQCPVCSKQFTSKTQSNKCRESHQSETKNGAGKIQSKSKPNKKEKSKDNKSEEPVFVTIKSDPKLQTIQQAAPQPLQQQPMNQIQPQSQHQQQQIFTFLPDQKQVLFTIPSNIVLTGFSAHQ